MGKFLETLTKGNLFSIGLLAWTAAASSVLKGSSATPPTHLEGRGLQREGGATTVPISVAPNGRIDQPIWRLDTKKYILTFNTGGSSGDR